MAKARFFRVATEGATTDGRTIDRAWIDEMVATYKPETFSARVFVEHVRGINPEGPFGAYGDVLSLKADDVQLSVGGQTQTRRALYAEIEPLPNLLALIGDKQKLFTSIEVSPNFAGSGKAYFMGLAVTDNPTSLGTEMLQFCAGKGDTSPLAHRKQQPENIFTAAEEVTFDFTEKPQADHGALVNGFVSAFKALFTAQAPAAVPEQPEPVVTISDAGITPEAMETLLQNFTAQTSEVFSAMTQKLEANETQLADLTAKLERTAPHTFTQRPPATGADDIERADC